MSDTINQITLEKVICKTIDGIHKVVPIQNIEHVSCFYNWLDSLHKLRVNPVDYIEADYYRGSENDLQNLFLEILALATTDHCYHGIYVLKRLEFLANEGLHMINVQKVKPISFKVSDEEANAVIANLAKKTKTSSNKTKKTVKISKKKPAKRVARDNKGRFTKNK
jgi:hypothetical protein